MRVGSLTLWFSYTQCTFAKAEAYGELKLDGATIDDLALDFTLPGYEDVPLKVSVTEPPMRGSIFDTLGVPPR